MPVIKISELPVKQYAELDPTDIMVIEDNSDTKQISIEQLKLFFSSDNKLQTIKNYFEELYEELKNEFENHVKDCSEIDEKFESKLSNLIEDHERTKAQIGNIQEQIVEVENNIKNIQKNLSTANSNILELQQAVKNNSSRIDENEKVLSTHEDRILNLEKDNEINKNNISKIQQELTNLTNNIKELSDKITQYNTENREYADKLYENLMLYIDYYHHIHEFPPNFDEPYKGDPMVARYIHPIGTIFETQDSDFKPEQWFPGTWKFIGTGASLDDNGNRVLDYYTYVRIE